ncbi:ABC transporter transmembrane domain-containing protein [Veronia pacifica]|uniref:Multidrug ABC transporter permease/ATP-binding protein n=1 Tax=Veronia pacifica TaxID=1080227 RepID=A0A1C3E900_9GAMM|nr:ABC transporter transmembrane domain-containing protein [Veronia pacifica]ODA29704.1 multidrug ABC transporter permease/ATP-binding protein [Veronia pacifica]
MNKKEILIRLLKYMLADKRALVVSCVLLLLASLADVSGPLLIRIFLDDYLTQNNFPELVLWGLAMAYIGVTVASGLLHYGYRIRFSRMAVGIVQTIRKRVYSSVLKQPLSAFDFVPIGKLVSRITNDTESLKDMYVTVFATFIKTVTLLTVMLVVMFTLSPMLAGVVFLLVPVVIGVMYLYQKKSSPVFRESRDLLSDINAVMSESIQGMSLIQLMAQEENFCRRFEAMTAKRLKAEMRIQRMNGFFLRPLIDLMSGVVLMSLVALFGWHGTEVIGVGLLYAFINYLGRVTEPLVELMMRLSLLQQAIIAGERLFELMDIKQQVYGDDDKPMATGAIQFDKVNFSYDGKVQVVKGVDIQVKQGGFLALVGHTGSGKSTLASLMMGFYDVNGGSIRLDGRPIGSLSHSALRQGVAMVQQDPHVLSDTLRENVSLGREVSDEMIWQALEQSELSDFTRELPSGLDTQLGDGEIGLSAGQKQLLALARVLVARPKILILDEATANIDSGTEDKVQRVLSSLRKDMTVVVIAHRLSTIAEADQILVLHRGEVVEQGNHRSLLEQQGRYWQMHELQQASAQLKELEQMAS